MRVPSKRQNEDNLPIIPEDSTPHLVRNERIVVLTLRSLKWGFGIFAVLAGAFLCSTMNPVKIDLDTTNDKATLKDHAPRDLTTNKKYFVIHAGPHKTGTTTIQHMCANELKSALAEDGYDYFGQEADTPILGWSMHQCQLGVQSAIEKGTEMPSCWNMFLDHLDLVKNHTRVFVSHEGIGRSTTPLWWQAAQEAITSLGFHLIVIYVYRPLHQWLPSAYNQHTKTALEFCGWGNADNLDYIHPKVMEHEGIDREEGTGFWFKWIGSRIEDLPDGVELRLVNMADWAEVPSHEEFFCKALPEAQHTCEALRNLEEDNERDNTSKDIKYSLMVRMAYKHALIHKYKNKRKMPSNPCAIAKDARRYHTEKLKRTANDLPMHCPSDEDMDKILEASLAWEREFFPQFHNESEHIKGFAKTVKKKKFCHVDVHKLMKQTIWKKFFMMKQLLKKDDKERVE